jgi:putative flippase GtrA
MQTLRTIYNRYRRVINFVFVGGGVALFGSFQMYLYVDIFHLGLNLAYILQTFLSLQINFNINDRWTWGDWRIGNGKYWHRWMKYHLSRLVTILLCQIIFSVLVYFGFHYLVAYGANIIFGFVINYITSSKFVFKRKRENRVS